jgi:signal peptidase II
MSSWLSSGQIVKLFDGELVWFVLVHNPGLAFGLRILPTPALAVISLIAASALGFYLYRYPLPMHQGLPFGLIMGGAIGNMIDRMRLGKVVDFISVDFPDFWMSRWPVFNVADSAVSIGIVWIVLVTLLIPETDTSLLPDNNAGIDSETNQDGLH